jgi:hypothetical protein
LFRSRSSLLIDTYIFMIDFSWYNERKATTRALSKWNRTWRFTAIYGMVGCALLNEASLHSFVTEFLERECVCCFEEAMEFFETKGVRLWLIISMHNTTGNTELNLNPNHNPSSLSGRTHLYSSPPLLSTPQTFTPIVMINNNNNNYNNNNNNNNNNYINNYQTHLPPRINSSQLNGVSSTENPDFLYSLPPSVPFQYVKIFNLFSNSLVFIIESTNYC